MDKANVLVVEDDQFLRELYADILENAGYHVDSAKDGEEALAKIQQGGYELVLLDIILPKLDGLEIMRRVKSNLPKNPNKTVIFFTNLDNEQERKEALVLGNGYLIKEKVTPENLVSEIKALQSHPQA